MKKFLGLVASFVLVLSAQSASAAQYQVYVTSATHVSAQQEEFSTIVQKGILIDTSKKMVRLQLSALCKPGQLCPEYLRSVDLPLITFKSKNRMPAQVVAQGNIDLNGGQSFTQVTITLNQDNAMDITINNSFGCKSNISSFIGSPATHAAILY